MPTYTPDITAYIASLTEEVRFAILNYCNIRSVPYQLKYTWASMVVDYYRWSQAITSSPQNSGGGASVTDVIGPVSSIQEGDTTVQFTSESSGSSASATTAHDMGAVLDSVIMAYKDQLNKFRRVVW